MLVEVIVTIVSWETSKYEATTALPRERVCEGKQMCPLDPTLEFLAYYKMVTAMELARAVETPDK